MHEHNKTKFEVEFTFRPTNGAYPGFQPHFHFPTLDDGKLDKIICQQEQIMAGQEEALAALRKIDEATTAAGVAQAEMADSLQETSDDVDELLRQAANGTLTPAMIADMQAKADNVSTIAAKLREHADFSKAIASKSPAQPVPVPVPDPLPPA